MSASPFSHFIALRCQHYKNTEEGRQKTEIAKTEKYYKEELR
jgi:hypothetical protein